MSLGNPALLIVKPAPPRYEQFDPWTDDFSFKHPLDKASSVPLDKTRLGIFFVIHGGCTGIKWNSPFVTENRYPEGATVGQKCTIRRKAAKFEVCDGELFYKKTTKDERGNKV